MWHVTVVHVRVLPEYLDAFIEATRLNHEASIREDGNRRFDVLRDTADPCDFLLYEAYLDAASAAAHKDTAHYQAWRETVAPMMAQPRVGKTHHGLFPAS
jgi:(4S)-4-hydroxy-5-phosphonooxypentane-2,3-dione isomerase